ncbi:DedA family protein [Streptomyces himalayensis]|uniref:VTT domain-containing protein n=1 Tax=Streptomyces himalayensis subsp. himalayensis TaxID=2756131 RepID=A0A7W0I716_9ACTN|nr:VTT domain-containing protein [Streptomyces himalayensis]MBA2944526.1 VTT domain-containing protein [Streptomyces himalayensis subsp. himalayensis]
MDIARLMSWVDITSGLSTHLAGTACWAYAILAITTLPPLLPNAVLLVTGGMLAARGEMSITLVLLSVAGSALLGDVMIHRFGWSAGGRVRRRIAGRGRQGELFEWAAARVQRGGIPFVVGVRFLPSGRLLGGLAAGAARYPAGRFAIGAALAETVWAAYSVGVGYFGGAVSDDPVYSVAIGLALSVAVAGVAAVAQRRTARSAVAVSAAASGADLSAAASGADVSAATSGAAASTATSGAAACAGVRARAAKSGAE